MNQKLSVCFVSATRHDSMPIRDPSVRYRCYHFAEKLLDMGHISSVVSLNTFVKKPVYDYDTYIFHRPSFAVNGFYETFCKLQNMGRTLIADYDDLIFGNEKRAIASSAVKNGTLDKEAAIRSFQINQETLSAFSLVTTATNNLRQKIKLDHSSAHVSVMPNFIPQSVIDLVERNISKMPQPVMPTIGYFAGTKSHDMDLATILDVLYKILWESKHIRLLILGPVNVPNSIKNHPRCAREGAVGYYRLFGQMTRATFAIAPLEGSEFNSCKSRVKLLESSLANIPLIATPIGDMIDAQNDYLVTAVDKNDWYEKIHELLTKNANKTERSIDHSWLKSNTDSIPFDIYEEILEGKFS